ncbi:TetR/AcrR family transcriptional regulator [Spirochaeta cellobiosiphila]|uniref:TetR/AcrR family transcriptional regulator n=1 Tax=Spirochaeta cellobiosiphila TaxID=504483 RepID=UPI000410B3A1|nr:TetR/AcrR family transcriptional regulator [Spirochaeta cellobiosiphila]
MGIAERKQRDKERRIQEIINAARYLFSTKGLHNTTMMDIAEQAELSRRTLYHYFASKEDISYVIMLQSYQLMKNLILKSWEGYNRTAYEKMEFLKGALVDFYHKHFDEFTFTLFLDFSIDEEVPPTEEASKCYQIIDSLVSDIARILKEGVEDGSLRPLGEPEHVALTILTMLQGTMQKIALMKDWVKERYIKSNDIMINTMFDIYLSAIKA